MPQEAYKESERVMRRPNMKPSPQVQALEFWLYVGGPVIGWVEALEYAFNCVPRYVRR